MAQSLQQREDTFPLSPAAQIVFNTFYSGSGHQGLQYDTTSPHPLNILPFTTIRALGEAPFISTYAGDAPFLLTGEEFFEDNPLIAASLQPSKQRKYAVALDNFRKSRPALEEYPMSLDHRLSIYIQERFLKDARAGKRQEMANLVCMLVIMYPSLRNQLGLASRWISGWKVLQPARSAAPFTKQLDLAFVWYLLSSSHRKSATILMLTFGACLRVSEAQKLDWEDVALPGDLRLAAYGPTISGLNIKDANTWRTTGRLQFVKISHPECVKYLQALKTATVVNTGNISDVSYHQYSRDLHQAAISFGFKDEPFTSHSARIGKSTEDFIKGVPVEQISIDGRWKSIQSLRYYVNNGRAWILDTKISTANQHKITQAADQMQKLLDGVPQLSRTPDSAQFF